MNVLLVGSSGFVSRGFIYLLQKSIEQNWNTKDEIYKMKLFCMDIKPKSNSFYKKYFPDLGITPIKHNIKKGIKDFIISNKIEIVINLTPENAVVIWNDFKEIPWKMFYIDASVYIDYFKKPDQKKYKDCLLLYNFEKFDKIKNDYPNVHGFVSSGMNPGNVNYFYQKGIKKYGDKGLKAIYVIENDTVSFDSSTPLETSDNFYISWSGFNAVLELAEEKPCYFNNGEAIIREKESVKEGFEFTIGKCEYNETSKKVVGHIVSHEEIYNISKRYPNIETAFIYNLRKDIVDKLNKYIDEKHDYGSYNIYDPLKGNLVGRDMVGVLLVYEDKEIGLVNFMPNNDIISGTTLQVSTGVYSALFTLIKNKDKINKLDWIDNFLEDDSYLNDYELYSNYILPITEFINNVSDGLLENRKKY